MSTDSLEKRLSDAISGEVTSDEKVLSANSRDTSIFEQMPTLVAYPENTRDVQTLVCEVRAEAERGKNIALAARSGGTDMSGGPLTTGVVVSFTKYMNHVIEVGDKYAITEPGVYYRDFETETLKKNLILPSYPASREIAAMGGIVANDSGGERTLGYGKTMRYVQELECVLSDGSCATFGPLTPEALEAKKKEETLEGEIYRKMDALITKNAELIKEHTPAVSKNSAGYSLWKVRDEKTGTFNLAKLICGSQGTLALWTKATLSLIQPKEHRAMLVVFVSDLGILPEIVKRVLAENPESFESYDDHTFTLAIRFLPEMLSQMGWAKAARLGIDFIPEAAMVATGGVPKMILMAEFAENTIEEADQRAYTAQEALKDLPVQTKVEKNEKESEKYWIVRRESFNLLRKNLHGMYASAFIDDFVVPPSCYPTFLPELDDLLNTYKDKFIYTIAGHIGSGNFHIIPLMDLSKPEIRQIILELAPKVYELVLKYGGTTTGEHNDGIIRTPYIPLMFGAKMEKLFEETKKIFDPKNIFNPGKKIGGTFADIERYMIKSPKVD